MNTEEIINKVNESLIYVLGVEQEDIKPESHIMKDLDADSFDFVELIVQIEIDFNILISDSEGNECCQVSDLYNLVENHLTKYHGRQNGS